MAPRIRLGPARGPKLLGLAVVAVLVVALVLRGRLPGGSDRRPTASPARTISTQAPDRIGNTAQCPPNWPVLAMSNHRSYPAGHPAKPAPVRGDDGV